MERRTWLVEIRVEKGLTQEEVANLSQITRAYYTQIENGYRAPSVSVAKRIAQALGFQWTIFFKDECSERRQTSSA